MGGKQQSRNRKAGGETHLDIEMASALPLLLLSLLGMIGQSSTSIEVSFKRVPCGRCVNPPCGRCGLTLIRRANQARQTTTARPVSTKRTTQSTTRRPTRRTSTTRRPTPRTSTTRRPTQGTSTTRRTTRQPTTPRKPIVQLCGEVVTSDHRLFCSQDEFRCQDFRT